MAPDVKAEVQDDAGRRVCGRTRPTSTRPNTGIRCGTVLLSTGTVGGRQGSSAGAQCLPVWRNLRMRGVSNGELPQHGWIPRGGFEGRPAGARGASGCVSRPHSMKKPNFNLDYHPVTAKYGSFLSIPGPWAQLSCGMAPHHDGPRYRPAGYYSCPASDLT